jgi:hypothetical protein
MNRQISLNRTREKTKSTTDEFIYIHISVNLIDRKQIFGA